jgi:hypothetical protein
MALRVSACVGLALVAGAEAFAPSGMATTGARLALRQTSARQSGLVGPKMMDVNSVADGAQAIIAAAGVANVPFVDEVTGDGAGFTSPLSHFGSVISLWILFSLPVWSAAYKKAGGDSPEWFGVSQVTADAPGIGAFPRYTPDYNGPAFSEGLAYVFSFVWKPPILIAWKPRGDLDRATMDPTRETVVSSLYKGLGGALDKTAF